VIICVRSTVGVERDLALLPHFIEHYRRLGVSEFRLILHTRDAQSESLREALSLLQSLDLEPADVWVTQSWNTGANAERHRAIVADLPSDAWIVSTDIDEFHCYPVSLPEFTEQLGRDGYEVVRGRLTDRVSRQFRIVPLIRNVNLLDQFSIEADFWIRNPGDPGKIMLHRKSVLTTPGHHDYERIDGREIQVFPDVLKVLHFKWFDGVEGKYTDPALIAHHSNSWEYALYRNNLDRNFSGFGRKINLVLHSQAGKVVRDVLRKAARAVRSYMR
jgi:hypothetical protein